MDYNIFHLVFFQRDGTVDFDKFGRGLIFMPSGLGYFNSAQTSIPTYSPLIFEISVFTINKSDHDGDGVLSINEDPNKDGNPYNDDTDEDGVINMYDEDDDGDGILTKDELDGNDPTIYQMTQTMTESQIILTKTRSIL